MLATRTSARLADLVRLEIVEVSDALASLREGSIAIALVPSQQLSSKDAPRLAVFELPFLFRELNEVAALQTSDVGTSLLADLTTQGFVGLGYWNGGMNQVVGDPINNSLQLKGKRVGIPNMGFQTTALSNFGADPVYLNAKTDFSIARATGEIDNFVAAPEDLLGGPYDDGAISKVNYSARVSIVLLKEEIWKNLPFRAQSILAEEISNAGRNTTRDAITEDENILNEIRLKGGTTITPTADFFDSVTTVWGDVGSKSPTPDYEPIIRFLQQFRATPHIPDKQGGLKTQEKKTISILYATDRLDEGGSFPEYRYGSKRAASLGFGTLDFEVLLNNRLKLSGVRALTPKQFGEAVGLQVDANEGSLVSISTAFERRFWMRVLEGTRSLS